MDENLNIEKLLGTDKFEIPSYQRAYSWEEPQIKQFLDDLKEATQKYYLGHFLFESGEERFQVIDGQQRITTCMIFFRAVINALQKKNTQIPKLYSFFLYDSIRDMVVLKTVPYDNAYFYDLIVDNTERSTPTTKSQRNMRKALSYFEKELSALQPEEILRISSLLVNATITRYTVADKAMAAQVFAFQNDRGKELSELEKIKSYFFLQIYINSSGAKQQNDVEYIDQQFTKIYEQIVRIKLHEDDVVNYYWRSRCERGLDAGRTLDEVKVALSREADKNKWIRDFTSELAAAFQFVEVFERDNSHPFAERIKQLNNLALAYPFMIKANRLHIAYDGAVFQRLLHLLENVMFRDQLRGGRAALTARMNHPLRSFNSEKSLDETISAVIEWIRYDGGYWGYWGDSEMRHNLDGYFYENRVDNYFYWQYELFCWGKGYGCPIDIKYSDVVKVENIEHIAPKTPTDGEPVAHGYGDYVVQDSPENGIDSGNWLNCIGNLMLISESHNKSIGNCPFADKLSSYETLSLLKQQLEIKSFATEGPGGELIWDVPAIQRRKKKMIETALEIWSLDSI